jgi:L-amino acid N-acyltransferase YncA
MKIIDVTESNVDEHGFFCCMSKKKSEGYQRKLAWTKKRFREGMRIKLLKLPDRGFIEYAPAERAWRGVRAPGWMMIHCLWVVGRSKGKGYGKALLDACQKDAKKAGMRGVAVVTSEGNWLASKKLYLDRGFECVDEAEPSFSLLAKGFKKAPAPKFSFDREKALKRLGRGLVVVRSDQCPYIDDAVEIVRKAAKKAKVRFNVVEIKNTRDLRRCSPTPFGVFAIALNGRLLSYHYLLEKQLLPLL